ncbi:MULTISPECIES: phage holin family protein [unclassified Frankia]|uniref:phage holin family protein n=1 Tax=unclassified Frankia TaxID=2632575 RepID=UPI0027DE8A0F|nr:MULTISPECIES: phage holin family protein [unclassified Frankia]
MAVFGNGDRRPGRDASLGELVALATKDVSLLVRQEIELAKAEVGRQVASAAVGIGLLGVAAGLVLGALLAFMIFVGELFAWLGLERFWAFLLTAGLLFLLAGVLAVLAALRLRKLQPPRRTVASVREDVALLRHATGGGDARGGPTTKSGPPAGPTPQAGAAAGTVFTPIPQSRDSAPPAGRRPAEFDRPGAVEPRA